MNFNVSLKDHHGASAQTQALNAFDDGYGDGLRGFFDPPEGDDDLKAHYRNGYYTARLYLTTFSP